MGITCRGTRRTLREGEKTQNKTEQNKEACGFVHWVTLEGAGEKPRLNLVTVIIENGTGRKG